MTGTPWWTLLELMKHAIESVSVLTRSLSNLIPFSDHVYGECPDNGCENGSPRHGHEDDDAAYLL